MSQSSPMPDLKALPRNDQIFLGAGVLGFIFSFIDFAHVTGFEGFGGGSISAWHGVGVLAGLLLLVSIGVGAVVAFAPSAIPQLPVGPRVAAVGLAALAFLFFLIRWLTLPGGNVLGHHYGFSLFWGGYVLFILNIVMIVFGFLGIKGAGEALPWESRSTPSAPPAA